MPEPDRIIADVTAALATADARPDAILEAVVEALTRARPAMWIGSLLTKDPKTVHLIARDDRNPEIAEYMESYQRASGFALAPVQSRVIESGQPLLIPKIALGDYMDSYLDDATRSHMERSPFPADLSELSAAIVPIRAGGATVGTLAMYLRDTSDAVGEDDLRWIQLAADQTGLAVQTAQLSLDANSRLEKIDAIHAVMDAVRASHDPNVALRIVIYRVTAILEVDASDILTIDEANQVLVTAAASGFSAAGVSDLRLPLDNPLVQQGLASRRVENLESAYVLDQARRRSLFSRERFRSYAVAPLASQGRWLGILEVFDRGDLNPDPEWFQFLDLMAAVAAIALDAAALSERISAQTAVRKPAGGPSMSAIETQILRLLVEGLTNREIAAQVHLSQSTIKFHVRQILDKTGAANRTDLTRRVTREGWV